MPQVRNTVSTAICTRSIKMNDLYDTQRSTSTKTRNAVDLRDLGGSLPTGKSQTKSRKRNCETKVGHRQFEIRSGINPMDS